MSKDQREWKSIPESPLIEMRASGLPRNMATYPGRPDLPAGRRIRPQLKHGRIVTYYTRPDGERRELNLRAIHAKLWPGVEMWSFQALCEAAERENAELNRVHRKTFSPKAVYKPKKKKDVLPDVGWGLSACPWATLALDRYVAPVIV